MENIKTTFFRGLKFLIPVFLMIYIFQNIYALMIEFLHPIIKILPEIPYFGHEYLDLRAFLTFIVFVFVFGILLKIGIGKFLTNIMADIFLKLVPGSTLLDFLLREKSGMKVDDENAVVVMNVDEGWVFGFVIEEKNEDGFIMVYVPGAPIPTGGTLYMMTEDKIKRVDISVDKALTMIWHLGKNSGKNINGKLPPIVPSNK